MTAGKSLVAVVLSVIVFANLSRGEDVPDDFKSGPIDCDTLKNDPQSRYSRMFKTREAGEPLLYDQLDHLRLQFWFTYPDPDTPNIQKPGHLEARDKFAQALFEKDVIYLQVKLAAKIYKEQQDASALRGIDILEKVIGALAGDIDGGIPQMAKPEFDAWVNATREAMGPMRNVDDLAKLNFQAGLGFAGEAFRKASNPAGKEYQAYVMERDWAEFVAAKRLPNGFNTKERYGAFLYFRFAKLPIAKALGTYSTMVDLLGRERVEAAALQVLRAPKRDDGSLIITIKPPIKYGPGGDRLDDDDVPIPEGVIGVYGSPLVAMEILATQDDDRRYLLRVLTDQNRPDPHTWDRATMWAFADRTYKALVLAFGEKDVLESARLVRTAKKRLTTADVMNPKAIGATRGVPFSSFEDVLARKNPRGYVRSALIFSYKFGAPETLDAAAVDKAYATLVSGGSEDVLLDVAKKMAARRPNLIYAYEIRALKEAMANPHSLDEPVIELIDYPEYLAWKKFKPGAKATYDTRVWLPEQPGSDRLVPKFMSTRQTLLLRSVDDEQVRLWNTSAVYDNNKPHPPRDFEVNYPAKYQKDVAERNAANAALAARQVKVIESKSGEEDLDVATRRVKAHWTSITTKTGDVTLITKTWTSDEVPAGLLRKTEEQFDPAGFQGVTHSMRETVLESFEGFALGEAAPPVEAHAPSAVSAPASPRPVPAPVPVPTAPVRPAPPAAKPPAVSDRKKLLSDFQALMFRAGTVQQKLGQMDEKQKARLPGNVRDASEGLTNKIVDATRGLSKSNDQEARKSFEPLNEAVTTIEEYLKK